MADDKGQQVRIGPIEFPEHLRAHYANFVNVNHTPWDFRLAFALIKTPMPGLETETASVDGELELHPQGVTDVIIPANLVHGLIMALQTNFERYLKSYGVPGMNPEGPQQQGEEDDRWA